MRLLWRRSGVWRASGGRARCSCEIVFELARNCSRSADADAQTEGLIDVFAERASFEREPENPDEQRQVKLCTAKWDLRESGNALCASLDEFNKRLDTFCLGALKHLDWTNVFLAGGAVLGCAMDEMDEQAFHDSDLDLVRSCSGQLSRAGVRSRRCPPKPVHCSLLSDCAMNKRRRARSKRFTPQFAKQPVKKHLLFEHCEQV